MTFLRVNLTNCLVADHDNVFSYLITVILILTLFALNELVLQNYRKSAILQNITLRYTVMATAFALHRHQSSLS